MGAYNNLDPAIAGLRLGIESLSDFIESFRSADAAGVTPYGVALFSRVGDPTNVFLAHADTATLTLNGAFTGSDTAIIVTIDGVAQTPIAYGTSDSATGNAVAAAILAALTALGIANVSASYNSSSHVFTVVSPGYDTLITLASSGGVTSVTTYTSTMIFMGISVFDQVSYRDSTGGYPLDATINATYFGQIWVNTSVAVNAGQAVYCIITTGATQGKFTNVAGTNNYPIKAIFRTDTTGAGLALIELRGKTNYAGTL